MKRMKRERITPGDFLDQAVLPVLFERLDWAFPEFGWTRKGNGWQATNREHTKTLPGEPRPDRVVCLRPFGFLVHGGGPTPWTAYVNGGTTPTGADFVDTVRALAGLAGVDASVLDRELTPEALEAREKRQKAASCLEAFLGLAKDTLRDNDQARAYLVGRGFREDALEDLPLGVCPDPETIRDRLLAVGIDAADLDASGLLADGRWTGRLVIPWADAWGHIRTIAARDLSGTAEEGAKYLYLKGGTKPPAFGLDVALRTAEGKRDLVLVEGLLDVVAFQAQGVGNVAALGGAGDLLTKDRWEALAGLGVRQVTLALDSDAAGRAGLVKALDNLRNVPDGPVCYVVDPDELGEHKDPDELVRAEGVDAWRAILAKRQSGPVWRGRVYLQGITPASPDHERRQAVEAVLDYDVSLRGPRVSLDREDLLTRTAEATGYTYEALADLADDHARRRRDIEAERDAQRLLDQAQRDAGDDGPRVALERLREELTTYAAATEEPPAVFSVDRLDEATKAIPEGRKSGWADLDALDVRFNPGELAIVGARTGHGKTSVLVNLLWNWLNASADPEELLVLYSAEEPEVRVYHRLLALASVNNPWSVNEVRDFLRGGALARGPDYGWPGRDLEGEKNRLRDLEDRLMIVYRPGWSCNAIADHARSLAQRRTVGGVFVDYLQRLPSPGEYNRRDQEISAAGRAFKHLAVDVGCPVVAAAQINRESIPQGFAKDVSGAASFQEAMTVIRRARPELHNLREGGSEQEADLVLGLLNCAADYRREAKDHNLPDATPFDVGVLKNRYGAVGHWIELELVGRQGLLRDQPGGSLCR